MTAKTKTRKTTARRPARAVAPDAKDLRDRIRETTVDALKGGRLNSRRLSRLVHDVFDGAREGLRDAVPSQRSSVLRQVFDGLAEAVHAASTAGSGALRSVRTRAEDLVEKKGGSAMKKLQAANEEFLDAVSSFAGKAKGEIGEELEGLVKRARSTAPKIGSAARDAVSAADGRIVELGGEAVEASTKLARSALRSAALAAVGLFDGIAETLTVGDGHAHVKGASRTTTKPRGKSGSGKAGTARRTPKRRVAARAR